jgi:hypothetical protein
MAKTYAERKCITANLLAIAEKMKLEAGVRIHITNSWRVSGLAGFADYTGAIFAPPGKTLPQLYTVSHECGHVYHKHAGGGVDVHNGGDFYTEYAPTHLVEYEAEKWAHDAFVRHGLEVPKKVSFDARWRVAFQCISEGLQFNEVEPEIQIFIAEFEENFALMYANEKETGVRYRSSSDMKKDNIAASYGMEYRGNKMGFFKSECPDQPRPEKENRHDQ